MEQEKEKLAQSTKRVIPIPEGQPGEWPGLAQWESGWHGTVTHISVGTRKTDLPRVFEERIKRNELT